MLLLLTTYSLYLSLYIYLYLVLSFCPLVFKSFSISGLA